MPKDLIFKFSYTFFSAIFIFSISFLIKNYAKKIQNRFNLAKSRYFLMKRIINFTTTFLLVALIILIWGIDVKNLWVTLSGIFAMIAVSFVAVWSLIGNILAGVIIYFTSPFKIDDVIEVLPDNIQGKIIAINTFYTLVLDDQNNYINIPNSLLLQKYIKNIKNLPK